MQLSSSSGHETELTSSQELLTAIKIASLIFKLKTMDYYNGQLVSRLHFPSSFLGKKVFTFWSIIFLAGKAVF